MYTFSTKKAELLVDRQSIHMSQLGEADLASRTNAVGEILQNAALGNTLFSHVFYINDVEVSKELASNACSQILFLRVPACLPACLPAFLLLRQMPCRSMCGSTRLR